MTTPFAESIVEDAALAWLASLDYPPDKQEKATQTVLEQAELLSEMWAVEQSQNSRFKIQRSGQRL